MNEHITDYLNYYVDLENPQYAVLLNGNWGCGKTFFIKRIIKHWTEPNNESDTISLKPIYISLNGVSSIHSINEKIRAEISPFLYSKGMKVAKKVLNGLLKTTVKIDMNLDEDDKSDGNFSFNVDSLGLLDSSNQEIKGKRIMIFDDIERCKIETDEIFGYINNFVEHYSCKVILLTDEKKIKDRYEKTKSVIDISYKDFKEKLIGQTFEVKSDIESAIKFFIKETKNLNLRLHNQMIIDLFKSSKLENLRVLKQALLDFSRLTSTIESTLKTNTNYSEFVKNFLAYFIVVYAELKTGNEDIKHFQDFKIFNDDEDKSNNQIIEKYRIVFDKYKIHHSTNVFAISRIFDYVENGFIESDELNDAIKTNIFFREEKEKGWEILWSWRILDDSEFKKLKNSVWKQFSKGEINELTILVHITGIFLDLIEENLLKQNKVFVLKKSKQIMKKIFQDNMNPKIHLVFRHTSASKGKRYHSYKTDEFKSLKEYFDKLLREKQSNNSKDYLKSIFENVDEESQIEIYDKLEKAIPDGTNIYEKTAIFKDINGKKLGKRIKKFSNKAIYEFIYFFHTRYYPEETYSNEKLQDYHKDDRQCLVDLKKELGNNIIKRNVLKNLALLDVINKLELIIDKIDKI